MKPFYRGLLLGILLKEKINEVCKFLLINGINTVHIIKSKIIKNNLPENDKIYKVNFVVKITDQPLFEEIFNGKFQPGWKYFNHKKVLKIEIPDKINIPNEMKVSDLFELKENDEHVITLDVPLFETFGKIYLYFTYFIDSQKFINVYTLDNIISKNDFVPKIMSKNILCASVKCKNSKIEYISNYLKLFYNNQTITPEMVLLNYDKLNIDINESKLLVIRDKSIREYSHDEIIE